MYDDSGLMDLYNRLPVTVSHGRGAWLYDEDGVDYLDCVGGIATTALGHAPPQLVEALTVQAGKLWHVSNMFAIPGQGVLARKLADACFADLVFFSNSGAEANECALKAARRFHALRKEPNRINIIGFAGSFHGRTYATINASGNPAYIEHFGPTLPGYVQLDLDDVEAIAAAVGHPDTAAVFVEPVQGEGGARAIPGERLVWLGELTRRHGVLLIHDEVQCGMGRTGRLFAHQWFPGAEPDIMTLAKALGSGFPVGACLATRAAAEGMTHGTHGSTYGGNPLAMAVAIAAFDEIAREETLSQVRAAAAHFAEGLQALRGRYPQLILEIRGKGLLIGLKLAVNNRAFIELACRHKLLLAAGGENCVRLLPSLLITAEEIDEVLARLDQTCRAWR